MDIIGIDPGTTKSAMVRIRFVVGSATLPSIVSYGIYGHQEMLLKIGNIHPMESPWCMLAIEMVEARGMPVDSDVFETVFATGRYVQRWEDSEKKEWHRIYRRDVKRYFAAQNDAGIRAALVSLYGGKEYAIGRKATPGPLYGIAHDCWQALAVAIYAWNAYVMEPLG